MVIGNLVIYAIGVPVLIAITSLDLSTAMRVGALDFVPWDLIKIAVAAAILPLAWRAVGSRGERP
jgi:biotin transport system substrate-specific component